MKKYYLRILRKEHNEIIAYKEKYMRGGKKKDIVVIYILIYFVLEEEKTLNISIGCLSCKTGCSQV